jgi:hypothetical protein
MEQLQHGIQREIWTFMEIQFILNFHVALNAFRLNLACVPDIKDNKSNIFAVMLLKNVLQYFSIRIGFLHTKAAHFFSYKFLSELF